MDENQTPIEPIKIMSVIEAVLERMHNLPEDSELTVETRTLLRLLQDLGFGSRTTMPVSVEISLFDEYNNTALSESIDQIRNDAVRISTRYGHIIGKIADVTPTLDTKPTSTFI